MNGNRLKIKLRTHLTDPDFEIMCKDTNDIYIQCVGYQRLLTKSLEAKAPKKPETGLETSHLEDAVAKEKELRQKAEHEIVKLRERLSDVLQKLQEQEREISDLRQKLSFTQGKIADWKAELLDSKANDSLDSDISTDSSDMKQISMGSVKVVPRSSPLTRGISVGGRNMQGSRLPLPFPTK